MQFQASCLNLGKVKDIVNEGEQVVPTILNGVHRVSLI